MLPVKPLILIDTAIIGGPGRGLMQLAKFFQEKGIQYLLCNFKYKKPPKSFEFQNTALSMGLRVQSLDSRFKYDLSLISQFYRLAKGGDYNIIQSHGYKSHLIAGVVAKLLGLPWVAFAHGWTSEDKKVEIYHKLDKILLKYANLVITVSPPLNEIFTRIRGIGKRTVLLLNAVDSEALPRGRGPQAVRLECDAVNGTLIGCIGRLSFEKGQDILIRAFAAVHEKVPHARLVILGDGPAGETLKGLVQALGIANKVIFKAHDSCVRDYYEALDLLVLPSRSEGLPNVILEAMSFSVPVLAADIGAVSEVIMDNVNGRLIPAEDERAISEVLLELLTSADLRRRIGQAGRGSLKPKFCPRARAEKILALYAEVTEQAIISKLVNAD